MFRSNPRLAFWIFFFWVGLLPVSNIVPMDFLLQDHYLYLPMMGVAALVGSASVWLRKRLGADRRKLLCLILGLPLLALSVASMQRLTVWRDDLSLWSDAVVKEPASCKSWVCYADVLRSSGQTGPARRAYERSLQIDPANTDALARLGDLYTEEGELNQGLVLLQKLLKINSSHVTGWASLGNNYLKRGNYVEAEKAYKHAQSLQPEAWQVQVLLGNLARAQDHFDLARDYYGEVELKTENNAENAYHLACVESRAGNPDAALIWLEKAFQRGYGDYDKLLTDKQLSPLWDNPGFNYFLQRHGLVK
jgi:tetratricopeptide (TPR) repeat protein